METHTFPITDHEKQKLDEVRGDLKSQPVLQRAADFLRSNPRYAWTACALALLAGYSLGKLSSGRN
jgi:hypothetical protein